MVDDLVEAQAAYARTAYASYVGRIIRDDAIVRAHRAGVSSRVIAEHVGGMDQANVFRAKRRAIERREVMLDGMPDGMHDPADAREKSGLSPAEFMRAVAEGLIIPTPMPGDTWVFRDEDVKGLRRRTRRVWKDNQ